MKTFQVNWLLVALAAVVSCGKENPAGEAEPAGNRLVELKARLSEDTKASVTSAGAVSWDGSDEISVWTSAETKRTFSVFSISGGYAHFQAYLDANETPQTIAVYPVRSFGTVSGGTATIVYPYTYTYREGAMEAPMAALIEGETIAFRHLGGMVQVQCAAADIPSAATQFFLVSNGKKMAGLFYPAVSSGMTVDNSVIGDNSKVTVTFVNDGTAKNFNVPVPTGEYGSIYAAFADSDGNKITEWQVLTDVTVERGDMFVRSMPSSLMRVATYNIRFSHSEESLADDCKWDARKLNVPGAMSKRYVDVLGSQENTGGQVNDIISGGLSGYGAIGLSNWGHPLSDHYYTSEYETSAIYYRNEAVSILESGTFWFSDTPSTPSRESSAYNMRCCNWAKMSYKGVVFYFYNAHLQVDTSDDDKYRVKRVQQVKAILAEIKKVSDDYPVIWTGDFNTTQATAGDAVEYVASEGTMTEARSLSLNPHGPYGTIHYFEPENPCNRRIDYIFVNDKVDVQSFWVDKTQQTTQTWESDHHPVIVDISFK